MRNVISGLALLGAAAATTPVTAGEDIRATRHACQDEANAAGEKLPQTGDYVLNCMSPLGHHASHREFTCPVGGAKFRSLVLGTHSTYGRHLDWQPISYMPFPTPVPVCPENGFVMLKGEYSEEELARYRKVIETEAYKKIFAEKHASFYLLAKFLEFAGEAGENRWWQMLNATWEAELCKSDKYAFYAGETIEAAKAHLATLEKSADLYWILNIIIPNMYRRTGQFDQAQAWLDGIDRKALESVEENEFLLLAFSLLQKAVSEKNTGKIPIEKPKKPGEKAED